MSKELVEGATPPAFLTSPTHKELVTEIVTPWPPVPEPGEKILIDEIIGPRGQSAYELAVELGFTGTEVEWLASLASGGLIDPVTNLPPVNVVEAIRDAIIPPYELDLETAYRLGKI